MSRPFFCSRMEGLATTSATNSKLAHAVRHPLFLFTSLHFLLHHSNTMRSNSHHEVKKSRRSKRKPLHRHRHRIRSHRSPSDSPSLPVSPRPQPLDLQPSAICTSDLEELEVEEVEQEASAIAGQSFSLCRPSFARAG